MKLPVSRKIRFHAQASRGRTVGLGNTTGLHVVEILDLRARILRETTESHVLLAAPAARAARSGRLVDVEAAGEWDDLAYLNAVDVGRDGGRQRRGSGVHIVRGPDDG